MLLLDKYLDQVGIHIWTQLLVDFDLILKGCEAQG